MTVNALQLNVRPVSSGMPTNAIVVVAQANVLTRITSQRGTMQSVNANALKIQPILAAFHNTLIIIPANACVHPSPVLKTNTGTPESAPA